jgi:2-dehydro-3-deoxy-D-gluconate 5-dehydrogenase
VQLAVDALVATVSALLPSLRLEGKSALVTGAGSGLGQAIAIALAESGADVAVSELPEKITALDSVCSRVRSLGKKAVPLALRLPDLSSIDEAVSAAVAALGKIDILVNNAGVNIPRAALDVTEADWDGVLDANLKGAFFMAQRVAREMVAGDGGRIVNIASQNGVVGYYKRAAYCASKAGLVNLTRVLALEWAEHKINVNAVGPTFVLTPLTQSTFDDPAMRADLEARIPLGRVAQPEDVVGAVVFLASAASAMVTGHTLLVDGGWTAL